MVRFINNVAVAVRDFEGAEAVTVELSEWR